MNAKIMRVSKEIDKTKGKISEFQSKLRELEKQKIELENIDIVDTVRGMNISFADLAELLKSVRPGSSNTSATAGQVGPQSTAAISANETVTLNNEQEGEE